MSQIQQDKATMRDIEAILTLLPKTEAQEWRVIASRQFSDPAAREHLDTLHSVIYSLAIRRK